MPRLIIIPYLTLLLLLVACNGTSSPTSAATEPPPLVISAVPDQDPEKLQRLYDRLTAYLEQELDVPVQYQPVTDYTAAVTAFRVGDLDLVWFGGLTGVQARLQVDGAQAIIQRDIDARFHSLFIANSASGLAPIDDLDGLQQLKGRTITFGSESSTSGRLMPQYFLQQAGVKLADFRGEPGFSGSHDATIQLVEAGSYEVGAVNEQVWQSRLEAGQIDSSRLRVLWRTPPYHDYHWVIRPGLEARYGEGFTARVEEAFLKLDPTVPEHQAILDLFGAEQFVRTENGNYAQIEEIARELGKIVR